MINEELWNFPIYHHCQREVPACVLSGEYIKMFSPLVHIIFVPSAFCGYCIYCQF